MQGACGRWDAADLRRGSVKEEYGDVWGMGHRYGVHLRVCVRGFKGVYRGAGASIRSGL